MHTSKIVFFFSSIFVPEGKPHRREMFIFIIFYCVVCRPDFKTVFLFCFQDWNHRVFIFFWPPQALYNLNWPPLKFLSTRTYNGPGTLPNKGGGAEKKSPRILVIRVKKKWFDALNAMQKTLSLNKQLTEKIKKKHQK